MLLVAIFLSGTVILITGVALLVILPAISLLWVGVVVIGLFGPCFIYFIGILNINYCSRHGYARFGLSSLDRRSSQLTTGRFFRTDREVSLFDVAVVFSFIISSLISIF